MLNYLKLLAVDCGDPTSTLAQNTKLYSGSVQNTKYPSSTKVVCDSNLVFEDTSSVVTITCTFEGKWTKVPQKCGISFLLKF